MTGKSIEKNNYTVLVAAAIPDDYIEDLIQDDSLKLIRNKDVEVDMTQEEILQHIADVDAILVTSSNTVDKRIIEAAGSKLRVVSTTSVGVDHLDVELLQKKGIRIGHTPDVLTNGVAELTIGLLITTLRNIPKGVSAVKNAEWHKGHSFDWMCGSLIFNRKVGILGLGRIGKAIGDRIWAFHPKLIMYTSRQPKSDILFPAEHVELDKLFTESDIIIVATALTPDTKHLLNKEAFKKMKSSVVIINIARGGIIDQDDLIWALQNKEIGRVGLDVTDPEPLDPNSPLLKFDNVVVLPHMGSAAFETRKAMATLAVNNLRSALLEQTMPAALE